MQLVLGLLLGLLLAGIAGFILYGSGYRLQPKGLRLPFMDFDASKFSALSPIQMFDALSRAIIAPSPDASHWLATQTGLLTPVLLVHLGWRVVCDSFVERYSQYPMPEQVRAQIRDLGAQNVEFIQLFERIHAASVRDADAIDLAFAREYFLRAPSLAQRILPRRRVDLGAIFERASDALNYAEYEEARAMIAAHQPPPDSAR